MKKQEGIIRRCSNIYITKALLLDKSTMANLPFFYSNEILFLIEGMVIGSTMIGHSKSVMRPVMPV